MLIEIELVLCLYEVPRVNRDVIQFHHLPCLNSIWLFVNKPDIKLCALSPFPPPPLFFSLRNNNTAPRSSLMLACLSASLL